MTAGNAFRFYIISEKHGLVAVRHDPDEAEQTALVAAVNSARTVYLHDRLTELQPVCATSNHERHS